LPSQNAGWTSTAFDATPVKNGQPLGQFRRAAEATRRIATGSLSNVFPNR
jgi:hypothetical protein